VEPVASPPDPGLCRRCAHARAVRSARGSQFWRCTLSERDSRFVKYPPLPVLRCPGYAAVDDQQTR
jgi:hypothetical protein